MKSFLFGLFLFLLFGMQGAAQKAPVYREVYAEAADFKFTHWIRMYSFRSGIGYEQSVFKKFFAGLEANYYNYSFPKENFPLYYGELYIQGREIMQAKIRFSYSNCFRNNNTYYKAGVALGYTVAKETVIGGWQPIFSGQYATIYKTNTYQGINVPVFAEYYVRLSPYINAGLGLEISIGDIRFGAYALTLKTGYHF
jgi:hypothetical protein